MALAVACLGPGFGCSSHPDSPLVGADHQDSRDATDTPVDGGLRSDGSAVDLGGADAGDVHDRADLPDGAAEPTVHELVDNSAWVETLPQNDPFRTAGNALDDVCPPEDYSAELTPEGVLFEINTTFCAWLTVTQPILQAIPMGAEVTLVVRHAEIVTGDSAYTLAVAIGDDAESVWSETVDAIADANEFRFTFAAQRTYQAGEAVYFHLRNHGVNTWNFVALTVTH